jgi:hypothetical protein
MRQELRLTEISWRLTQRNWRVSEVSMASRHIAFRNEVRPPVVPHPMPAVAMEERISIEGRSRPPIAPAIAVPVVNVEQLANQVIKQIDRRIIARRERMGQV